VDRVDLVEFRDTRVLDQDLGKHEPDPT
jgi:hypothetical protein